MNRGRLPIEYIRRPIHIHRAREELGHPGRAPRPHASHTELSRAVSGAIGCYHIISGIVILLGVVKKWRFLADEMSRNQSLTHEDREKDLIRPYAHQIASHLMFTGLGVILLLSVCRERRACLEAWLSCTATMNFFTIIRGTEFNLPMYGVVWDVLKSICEICVVWSYTMDLRKDEARLESLNRTRRLLNIPVQVPVEPGQVDNNNNEGGLNEILDPNTNQAVP